MPIHFIPNDPSAQGSVPRVQNARPDPPEGRARFALPDGFPPEAVYAVGSSEFLHWQCREAALAALDAWGRIAKPLKRWRSGKRRIRLVPDAGGGLRSSYQAEQISFGRQPPGEPAAGVAIGASTDAVAHEVGHALLDSLRPDLWKNPYPECAAFQEGFADCISLLVGFFDTQTRTSLASTPALRNANPLEAIAEDVARAVRLVAGPKHPASEARHALNTHQWTIPTLLPPAGRAGVLSAERHSFGQVFSGCFYDLVCRLFANGAQTADGLLAASTRAGELLVAGISAAPPIARFYQAVGRAMILHSDAHQLGHHLEIRDAFDAHGIALGSSAMLAPSASLAAPAPKALKLSRSLRRQLKAPLDLAPRAKVRVGARRVGSARVTEVVAQGELSVRSKRHGRVSVAVESPVWIGNDAGRAVLLGAAPAHHAAGEEVAAFVRMLEGAGEIATPRARAHGRRRPSHRLVKRGRKLRLERVSFECGPLE
jgi:hypothetical protein